MTQKTEIKDRPLAGSSEMAPVPTRPGTRRIRPIVPSVFRTLTQ